MPKIFNADMIDTVTAEDISEYPLPYDDDTIIRIRSVSTSRLRQYQEAQEKGGSYARNQQYQLIKESVINENDQEVFATADQVRAMAKGKARFFMALANMVGKHNGSEDEVVEREDAGKKSDFENATSDSA